MAVEDFTTYDEHDPNGVISFSGTNEIDVNSIDRDNRATVIDNKGVGHFGNFEHYVEAKSAYKNSYGYGYVWAVDDNGGDGANHRDMRYHIANDESCMAVRMFRSGSSTKYIRLFGQIEAGATNTDDWNSASADTWYYLVIERSGTTATCKIYSDASHTNLLDTLTVTCESTSYRYIWGFSGHDSDDNGYEDDYNVRDLDLREAVDVDSGVTFSTSTGNVSIAKDDTSPVKLYTGSEVIGLEIVDTSDADATGVRVQTTTGVKALKKYT